MWRTGCWSDSLYGLEGMGAISCAGLADASGALQIAPLDLSSSTVPAGPVASSLDSEATCSEALLGSSAPSPSTVLPLHPGQVWHDAAGMPSCRADSIPHGPRPV